MDNAEVSAQVLARGGRSLSLDLLCFNDGSEILDIVPADISVTGYNDLGIPYTFKVFSAEQYIRRRNTRNAIIGGVVVVATVASCLVGQRPSQRRQFQRQLVFVEPQHGAFHRFGQPGHFAGGAR